MPLHKLLQSLRSQCHYGGPAPRPLPAAPLGPAVGPTRPASRKWPRPAAQATGIHTFNEQTLRQQLAEIAQRSDATDDDIERALEEGFTRGVVHAAQDGFITREEEEPIRAFRDQLALENDNADPQALYQFERASDRVTIEARLAAISVKSGDNGETHEQRTSPAME